MKSLKVNLNKITAVEIKLIVNALKKGQVLVIPTDTIYGLSCLANDQKAINRIKRLKGNSNNKPLSILVSDIKMLNDYVYISSEQEKKIKKIWSLNNRPTTVILKHRRKLPSILTGDSDGLAARLPKSVFLIKIIKEVGFPIVSTSLNLTGEPVVSNLMEINNYFPSQSDQPDLVVDAGVCRRHKASKILDLREVQKVLIIRN